MKLLFENWRQYLEEEQVTNSTLEANIEKVYDDHNIWNNFLKIAVDIIEFRTGDAEKVLGEIFGKIPPLTNHLITGLLGVGTKGIVLGLDNGHIIKLFRGGYLDDRTGQEELDYYASSLDKLFSKEAKAHTLPVFEQGKVEIDDEHGKRELFWVEMAKLKPLNKHWKDTGRGSKEQEEGLSEMFQKFKDFLNFEKEWEDSEDERLKDRGLQHNYKRTRNELIDEIGVESERAGIYGREFESLLRTIKSIFDEYGSDYLEDLHAGNIGALESSVFGYGSSTKAYKDNKSKKVVDYKANPVFVLFDP